LRAVLGDSRFLWREDGSRVDELVEVGRCALGHGFGAADDRRMTDESPWKNSRSRGSRPAPTTRARVSSVSARACSGEHERKHERKGKGQGARRGDELRLGVPGSESAAGR
jgi:hypothetical protein